MSRFKEALKNLFMPLSLLNRIVPKDKECVLFYSNLGFRDNIRSVYDYVVENGLNHNRRITVATDDFRKYRSTAPENVRFVSEKRGILSFFRSGYCFYSFGKYPIKPSNGQTVVNLWHGMPIKSVGRLIPGCERQEQNYFTHIIATSEFFADIMCRAFGAQRSQVIICAQPRCDEFFKESIRPDRLCGFDKVILWLPTFLSSKRLGRCDGESGTVSAYNADFLKIVSKSLKEKNVLLVIKPHPMDDRVLPEGCFDNIFFIDEEKLAQMKITVYGLMKFADTLVTDFSSVSIDYLLLSRPMAFTADRQEYGKNRGFSVPDPEIFMPGARIAGKEDFERFIADTADGKDRFKNRREKCRELCVGYSEQSGCRDILEKTDFFMAEEKR